MKGTLIAGGACALVVAGVAVGVSAQASTARGEAVAPASTSVAVRAPSTAQGPSAGTAGMPSGAGTAAPDGAQLERRRDLRCARVPNAITGTQQRIARLAGDASVRGSLAWLGARVDEAEAAGRDELAAALRNRLAFRKELAEFLPQRLELLQRAQSTICAAQGTPGSQDTGR